MRHCPRLLLSRMTPRSLSSADGPVRPGISGTLTLASGAWRYLTHFRRMRATSVVDVPGT